VNRGDLYRVKRPGGDPKRSRVFAVVSRPALVASRFSTVICAPVYSQRRGLATEVEVGPAEGLKHDSALLCDALVSIPKPMLVDYVGSLAPAKLALLDRALRVALHLE
jgi:mRNA interferase MazF